LVHSLDKGFETLTRVARATPTSPNCCIAPDIKVRCCVFNSPRQLADQHTLGSAVPARIYFPFNHPLHGSDLSQTLNNLGSK
jgi:hypothetical protein